MRGHEVYCRYCGVRLRRFFGQWRHVQTLGPVPCPDPEPEPEPDEPAPRGDGRP